MAPREEQMSTIGAGGMAGVPRRRLLQGVRAFGLAATLRPTAVLAKRDDDDERLGPFGPWSMPRNLGAVINQSRTTDLTTHPGISKTGLSLYISSTRPGGVNGANIGNNSTGFLELWVSQRASLEAPWGAPVNLDAFNSVPVIIASAATPMLPISRPTGTGCSLAVFVREASAARTCMFLDAAS